MKKGRASLRSPAPNFDADSNLLAVSTRYCGGKGGRSIETGSGGRSPGAGGLAPLAVPGGGTADGGAAIDCLVTPPAGLAPAAARCRRATERRARPSLNPCREQSGR